MAYVNEFERIGSGNIRWVQISEDGVIKKVRSRGGLFHGDIRVVTDGPHKGKVLIPFWANVLVHAALRDGQYPAAYHDHKNLVYQMFTDVYSALRYTYYLLEKQYGITFQSGEKGRLVQALKLLEEYNDAVVNLRKDTAQGMSAGLAKRAGEILKEIELNPRNAYKREARDLVVTLGNTLDSMDRVNQSVKMAKNVAARNRLLQRKMDILSIEPHIVARRATLLAVIDEMELYWLGVHDFLTRVLMEGRKVDSERCMDLLRNKDHRNIIMNRLYYYAGQMDYYDIRPFANTSRYVGEELAHARWRIEHYRYDVATFEMMKIWNSLKLRKVRTSLERVLTDLTCSLFGQQPVVDKRFFNDLIFRCRQQIEALKKVDETGFSNPVATQSRTFIQAAVAELVKKKIPAANKAKDYLKKAASML